MHARHAAGSGFARPFTFFLLLVAASWLTGPAHGLDAMPAQTTPTIGGATAPNPLLTIDQNRTTVIDRIVTEWGIPLEQSGAGFTRDQLRTMLQNLRADHLLAASLAGSLPGLREVLANSLTSTATASSSRVHIQAIGDLADDLVYTPVNPCRLFDTRPAQGGLGVLNPNVRRTYGATSPVPSQGGPGNCNAPVGAATVAMIQIGTLTPAGSGYVQGGPQGIATFPNALLLYQAGDQYGTSVAMPLNVTNGRFDVQVQFAATDLYGDLLGYFAPPVATALSCVDTVGAPVACAGGGGNCSAFAPSCPAGYSIASINCETSDYLTFNAGFNAGVCDFHNTAAGATNGIASRHCCRVPGR